MSRAPPPGLLRVVGPQVVRPHLSDRRAARPQVREEGGQAGTAQHPRWLTWRQQGQGQERGVQPRSPPLTPLRPHRLQHLQEPCPALEGPTWKAGASVEAGVV